MTSALNAVIFTDGRPGHEKQSRSILRALASMTVLSTHTLKLPPVQGVNKLFMGLAAFLPHNRILNRIPGLPMDLVIGTGSATHLPMIAYKRRSKARLVTCMAPDPLLRPCFDLCLIPRHDSPLIRPNIFSTFGPPCMTLGGPQQDRCKGLILAGGIDPKSHHWDTSVFMTQIQALDVGMSGIRWTIASSPRTPADTIEQLRVLVGQNENMTFFSADETPPGWIEAAYSAHAQVWVTADSVSMVYEALSAGCRVGVLPVAWKHAQNKFQQGIDDLKANGLILDYRQWQKGQQWPAVRKPLNEAERCAREILKRWWPERLA
jgi:mitochondrial fission protein ELM1